MRADRRWVRRLLAIVGLAAVLALPTRPSTAAPGDVTTFSTLAAVKGPTGMALGPDGNLWVTSSGPTGRGFVTRVQADGTMTRYDDSRLAYPGQVVEGTDGLLWFTTAPSSLASIDPADGEISVYPGAFDGLAAHLTPTAAGVWFTDARSEVGRVAPDGSILTFPVPGACCSEGGGLTVGPDGNLWSTLPDEGVVARTTPAGTVTPFAVGGHPAAITSGPDGNLWITDRGSIVRMTPAGQTARFANDLVVGATELVPGGDGNLWFTSTGSSRIGRVTPSGLIRLFWHPSAASATAMTVAPSGDVWYVSPSLDVVAWVRADGSIRTFGGSGVSRPGILTNGPDGDLWFGAGSSAVGAITPAGEITTHDAPADLSAPQYLVAGPDGNIWFTAPRVELDDPIGRITPAGEVQTFDESGAVVPDHRTVLEHLGGVDLTVGPDDDLWFADTEGQIVRSTVDGDLSVWHAPGYPVGPFVVGADNRLWIGGGSGGSFGGRIFRLDPRTGGLRTFAVAGRGLTTHHLVAGPDGRVWFVSGNDRIGRIATDGTVRTFGSTAVHDVEELVLGPDGALWFSAHRRIGRITTTGRITTWSHPAVGRALALTTGDDDNVWFVTPAASRIGRITPTGRFSLFRSDDVVVAEDDVEALATDDGIWVTSTGTDRVAHVTYDGAITTTDVAPLSHGLAIGADGDLWVGQIGGVARVELP